MKEILFSGGVPKEAPTNAEEIIGDGMVVVGEIVASGAAADFSSEKLAPNQSRPASSEKLFVKLC